MTQKALPLLLALFAYAPAAHAADSSAQYIKRIEAGCAKDLKGDIKDYKAVCSCIRKNYESANRTEEELEVMARSYEMDSKAEEELQGERFEDVLVIDYDITENCRKKPTYRHKK